MEPTNKESGRIYRDYVKRILDIVTASLAFVILSPLIAVSAILVRIKLGSPVIFRQARAGRNEKIFYLVKFRSMTNAMDENGKLLPDSQRLTKFGKFLRSSSIDELPELINIIRGDMSIVGPRPLSIYYLPHYSDVSKRRHEVRPGLTGLAQINGRNNLDWDERFEYDIRYVDHISFTGDVKIMVNTVLKVLKASDITVRGTTSVMDFGPYTILKEEGRMSEKRNGMTYSEIGSYFWLEPGEEQGAAVREPVWLPAVEDCAFTFSGRTAIDLAVRDIRFGRSLKKVYVPSYCCVSMLQAFFDQGVEVKFYDVIFEGGKFRYGIEENHGCDAVFILSYFGLDVSAAHEEVRRLHEQGLIVIEDITHSLLRDDSFSPYSDYLVASLRKWFAVPAGGWVGKKKGTLSCKPDLESERTVDDKIESMHEKYSYLTGGVKDKEHFLAVSAKFENELIHVDRLLRMDTVSYRLLCSTDVQAVVRKRRENAGILADGLKNLPGNIIALPDLDLRKDVPLFLPVFLEHGDRESLRQFLIGRGIYCPVHWPEVMGAPAGVRENELSLICDQRYGEGDMREILSCIREWYAENKKSQ